MRKWRRRRRNMKIISSEEERREEEEIKISKKMKNEAIIAKIMKKKIKIIENVCKEDKIKMVKAK